MTFLDKEKREICWNNRDVYWNCLDKNEDSESLCAQFRKHYEKTCPIQWVKHFDRRREYNKFKEEMEKTGKVPNFPQKESLKS
ncbi:cytochrome c oxidase assembly factor 6 homolog [Leptopilina boulardi]|uniref:cytochrome c oxidase assembly factor 6 homolog n=1 Tax=Leptopilina boulardi TaxID=63433 RepID=UPI0021F62330|nr:cytochrome c oxidase assembly factor 6 homolog [Leptopilina boulardi]